MSTEKIVIAKNIYVGFSDREERNRVWKDTEFVYEHEQYLLGFATYHEDNAAFRKRQSTIAGWSRGLHNQPVSRQPEIFKNTPQKDLRISRNVTHGGGWNDLTVYWRIIDPRGFELEITSGNLAKLFQYCNITGGIIEGECVYGFDKGNGSKVVLLPVNSEIYQDSIKSTEIHEAKTLKIKDIALGDIITMKNGAKGVYLGKQHLIHVSNAGAAPKWHEGYTDWSVMSTQKHFMCTIATPLYSIDDEILVFATPNIVDVQKTKHVLTEKEAEIYANTKMIKDGKKKISNIGPERFDKIICTSFKMPNGPGTFATVPIDLDRVKQSFKNEIEAHQRIIESQKSAYKRWNELIDKKVDPEFAAEVNPCECLIIKWANVRRYYGALFSVEMEYDWGKHDYYAPYSERLKHRTWTLKITGNPMLDRTPTKMDFALDRHGTLRSMPQRVKDTFTIDQLESVEELCVDFDNGEGIVRYAIR